MNNLYENFEFAHRYGFSIETVLIKITDDILHALDNKRCTALVMIDMSSVFDSNNPIFYCTGFPV